MNLAKLHRIINHHLYTLGVVTFKKYFPNLFYKLKIKPWIAILIITHRCNLNCVTCSIKSIDSGKELNTDQWKTVIIKLKNMGIHGLIFSGGEPLLRDDITKLIKYAKDLKISEISLLTNGYLLNGETALKLIDAGVKYFSVSVDAIGDKFDKIRGIKGGFQIVAKNCESLSRIAKKKNIKVLVVPTISNFTLESLMDVIKFADNLGFSVYFNLFDFTPYFFLRTNKNKFWVDAERQNVLESTIDNIIEIKRKKPHLISQSFSSLLYIKNYFRDRTKKNILCAKIFTRIFIDPEGRIYSGCLSFDNLGNILEKDLKDITNSYDYLKFCMKGFLRECPGCSCGYHIDFRYDVPFLIKEARYRIFR